MPCAPMFEITQFSIRTRSAAWTRMPFAPPWPLMDKPRRTTVAPGAFDRHPVARRHADPSVDPGRRNDRDRFGDSHRAVAGGVEDDDLATRVGRGDRSSEGAA